MLTLRKMDDMDLRNKRVLIREDFNVPVEKDVITDDTRIVSAMPTIQNALKKGAAVILLSHRGRPEEGRVDSDHSLILAAEKLSKLLNHPVRFETQWLDGVEINPGEIVLCENVRFNPGEKDNHDELAKKMAALCDVFVMDAFATAHRAQASTHGVAKYAKEVCAGPLLTKELEAIDQGLNHAEHPLVTVVGGSKVSSKLTLLKSILEKADTLIVGGGIANTFLKAAGMNVGASLYEEGLVDEAAAILKYAEANNKAIPLPVDVVVAQTFSSDEQGQVKTLNEISDTDMILDIGPETAVEYVDILGRAKTILWNGPVGVFEFDAFSKGTEAVARGIAKSAAFSIAGGGDTLAAISKFNVQSGISYISTGGGAFLTLIEGKSLPGVEVLERL